MLHVRIRRNHICDVQFDCTGKSAISGSDNREVHLWDIDRGQVKQVLPHGKELSAVQTIAYYSVQNGKHFIASTSSEPSDSFPTIKIWSTQRAKFSSSKERSGHQNVHSHFLHLGVLLLLGIIAVFTAITIQVYSLQATRPKTSLHLPNEIQTVTIFPLLISELYQAILIHHQEFPRYRHLYLDNVDIVQEEHDSDSTLIHCMIFPHDFRQPITKNVIKETENFITSRGEPKGASDQLPAASVGSSWALSLINNQTEAEHELCKDQSATMSTVGHSMVANEDNDVEVSTPSSLQIWLSNGSDWEPDVQDGHHHPVLRDHRLCVREGSEPSWVTRKILATYKARGRTKDGIKTVLLTTNLNHQKQLCNAHGE
ncbi:hypothetical protein EV702DRAFT_1050398 [Suillus placidus]|uniref:Uncharacterized protein n=1 Tax=Suillus placidus TaxID=48579 RepID=A0A9P6ZIZ4_9AGAM|nr:hypothetical protein EV702DRAFT_1050398 [Suillus placidus]